MRKHFSKKRVVLAAIIAVALAIASGVAYAYFTSSGSNTGSAGVGSDSGLQVDQVGAPANLQPDGVAHGITVRVTNNAAFQQSLKALTITVKSTGDAGCLSTWFTVVSPSITSPPIVLDATGGANDSIDLSDGSIAMNPSAQDQDACKGADITLNLVAS